MPDFLYYFYAFRNIGIIVSLGIIPIANFSKYYALFDFV